MRTRAFLPAAAAAFAAVLAATAGQSATLSIVTDQSFYLPGEVITIEVIGDSQGEQDESLLAAFSYDPTGLVNPSANRFVPLTSLPGNPAWLQGGAGGCNTSAFYADACLVVNMIAGLTPTGISSPEPFVYAVVTAIAGLPGTYALDWFEPTLDFFSLNGGSGVPNGSIRIVPEPGTALLMALGITALGIVRRRRL